MKTRFESQLSRMNCQMFSTGLELRALWRQRNECDVAWNDKALGHVPTRLVDDQDGMGTGRDGCSDLRKVQVHRRGIAIGQYQTRALALLRADGTENIG